MPVFPVSGETECVMCGAALEISCLPEMKSGWGVCNACGMIYKFNPKNPVSRGEISSVECRVDRDSYDWEIIQSYYESTGNPAAIVGYADFDEAVFEQFFEWANQKYDAYWGKSIDEIPDMEQSDNA